MYRVVQNGSVERWHVLGFSTWRVVRQNRDVGNSVDGLYLRFTRPFPRIARAISAPIHSVSLRRRSSRPQSLRGHSFRCHRNYSYGTRSGESRNFRWFVRLVGNYTFFLTSSSRSRLHANTPCRRLARRFRRLTRLSSSHVLKIIAFLWSANFPVRTVTDLADRELGYVRLGFSSIGTRTQFDTVGFVIENTLRFENRRIVSNDPVASRSYRTYVFRLSVTTAPEFCCLCLSLFCFRIITSLFGPIPQVPCRLRARVQCLLCVRNNLDTRAKTKLHKSPNAAVFHLRVKRKICLSRCRQRANTAQYTIRAYRVRASL